MTALIVTVAIPASLALAWHLRAVARRWSYTTRPPSGLARQPRSGPPRPLPSAPGPDGSPTVVSAAPREDHRP